MLRRIYHVKANDNFTLECEMENGEIYLYDMSYIQKESGEVIQPLRDINVFKEVWIEYGALEWSTGLGIHGDTVVRDGQLISSASAA